MPRKPATKTPGRHTSKNFPEWIQPMAATLTQERFTGPEWIFERKFDGIRLLAFKQGREVRLFSRNRLPQSIPSVAQAIKNLPVADLILDGEMTWGGGTLSYHVFDIMWLDGRDLTSLPIEERRELLSRLPLREPLLPVEALSTADANYTDKEDQQSKDTASGPGGSLESVDGLLPWERARSLGWEGVIAKRRGSLYEQRRSPHWLKMKCELAQEFVVGGFTDPQGKRVGLGALLVGYFDRGDFVFAGKIGTGFDTKLLLELREQLDKLEIAHTPFTRAVGLPRLRAHWVKPKIVVQVGFIEWTVHGKLRHPRLLGVRRDKS